MKKTTACFFEENSFRTLYEIKVKKDAIKIGKDPNKPTWKELAPKLKINGTKKTDDIEDIRIQKIPSLTEWLKLYWICFLLKTMKIKFENNF